MAITLNGTTGVTTTGLTSNGIDDNATSTAMTLDTSGNVGIGTASPSYGLHLASSTDAQAAGQFERTGGAIMRIQPEGFDAKFGTYSNTPLEFMTNSTERMRLDSIGNLLVGKTVANTTTLGNTVYAGIVSATMSGDPAIFANRAQDGPIIELQKSGSSVGSIGTSGGLLNIGSGDTGLLFAPASDLIIPSNPTNTANGGRDAAIDLGNLYNRFKDLYLSGGVYLGGTGAANKLDDYEEGTYQTSFACTTSGTITLNPTYNKIFYTKIGRAVTISGYIRVNSVSAPTGVIRITLPFVNSGTGRTPALSLIANSLASGSITDFWAEAGDNQNLIYVYAGGGSTVATSAQQVQANTDFRIGGTYFTDA